MGTFRFGPTALISLTLCAIASLAIIKNWRLGVLCLFLWLPFEDYVRKFAGNDLSIFFVKDVLLATTYASALLSRKEGVALLSYRNQALLPLALWAAWAVAEIFNPRGAGVRMGIVGFRMSFFYIPLFFLGASAFRSDRELVRFTSAFLVAVLVVCAGGLAQLVLGAEFLNPPSYAEQLEREFLGRGTEDFGRFLYLTSFFNNAGRYGRFLMASLAISGGLFAYAHLKREQGLRLLAGAAFFLVSVSLLLNGSRTIFLCLIMLAAGFAVMTARGNPRLLLRNLSGIAATLILAALLLWVIQPSIARAVFGFYYTTLSPYSSDFEITGRLRSFGGDTMTFAFEQAGVIGFGTGTASLGGHYVADLADPWLKHKIEGGYAAILWEHGFVGLALFLWWACALLLSQYRASRALEGRRWHGLGTILFLWSMLFLGPLTFMGMQVFQDFVPNSLFWFWSGVVFSLRSLKPEEEQGSGTKDGSSTGPARQLGTVAGQSGASR